MAVTLTVCLLIISLGSSFAGSCPSLQYDPYDPNPLIKGCVEKMEVEACKEFSGDYLEDKIQLVNSSYPYWLSWMENQTTISRELGRFSEVWNSTCYPDLKKALCFYHLYAPYAGQTRGNDPTLMCRSQCFGMKVDCMDEDESLFRGLHCSHLSATREQIGFCRRIMLAD